MKSIFVYHYKMIRMKKLFTLLLLTGCFYITSAQGDSAKKVDELKEVEIRAKKQMMELHPDKMVVNVQSMITAATSNTLEVLERIPGVSVNQNGEISLNGRSGVLVLIDNKTMYLSPQDLAAYLKSIPGNRVDKVELMDNPPARFDANGAAVVHIRLKKNRNEGLTGNLSSRFSQGRYSRTSNSVNISYYRKKINTYINATYDTEKFFNTDVYDRHFFNANKQLTGNVDLFNKQLYKGYGYNINGGLDYSFSEKTTAGITMSLNESWRKGWFNYDSKAFDADGIGEESIMGTSSGTDKRSLPGVNLNMSHKFSKERELTADVNYLRNRSFGDRFMNNYYYSASHNMDSATSFIYMMPVVSEIYVGKADYSYNLPKDLKIEGGIKASFINNENINEHYDVKNDSKFQDESRSSHFHYRENINAVYFNITKMWRRVGLQAGVRGENTNTRGVQLGNEEVEHSDYRRSYNGLFPSLFINYKLDSAGKRSLVVSFNKRINRPNYQLLNPFVYFRDEYSLTTGNPFLKPQTQYRYEIKYQHKQWLWTALSYNRFVNVIFPATEARGALFVSRPDNVGKGYMIILNTGMNVPVNSWWQMNSTIRIARLGLRGVSYSQTLDKDLNVARIDVMNFFKIGKTLSGELGAYYASKDLNNQSVTRGMYRVNAALQKKIFKEKGSIKLSVDDMFRSWVYRNRSFALKQAEFYHESYADTQRFGVAFNYRFGKENQSRRRRSDTNGEERERLN